MTAVVTALLSPLNRLLPDFYVPVISVAVCNPGSKSIVGHLVRSGVRSASDQWFTLTLMLQPGSLIAT